MKEIFVNYEPFYNMVLSTTILSNSKTPELVADSKRIIEYIGKAYNLTDDFIEKANEIILEKLITLGLSSDQQAVYSSRNFGTTYQDEDSLFDIKGDVLATLESISKYITIAKGWFDYSHYKTYQADVRFYKINSVSSTGELITTRQVGIHKMLGIGCETNTVEAIKRFTQAALWGDIPSMYYLAYAYKIVGNEEKSKLYYEICELSNKYLNAGYTVLPNETENIYSKEARNWYAIISSIKQDIICCNERLRSYPVSIDLSFVEAISLENLDENQRMYYINNYDRKEWKNLTNNPTKTRKVGFN